MQLIRCVPYNARLTPAACASSYRNAQHGSGPEHRLNCVNCPIGKANAAGKESGAEVMEVEAKGTPQKARRNARTPLPDRTCEHCKKPFKPHRKDQRFCPGGKCNAAYHVEKKRRGDLPQRVCEQCLKPFTPNREEQRFCPGGACNMAYQNGKRGQSADPTHKAPGGGPPENRAPAEGVVKIYPTDLGHAHAIVMSAVEENPDLFAGLSVAALPVLARKVAGAIVRARDGREVR